MRAQRRVDGMRCARGFFRPVRPLVSHPLTARALAVGFALALGGCAAFAPVPAAPIAPRVEVPARWSQAGAPQGADAESLASWWQRFDDPLLSELIARALEANPRIESAQAALRQSRAVRDVAVAQQGPTLGASGSLQRARSGNSDSESRVGLALDAAWELDLFGAARSAVAGRDAAIRARTATLGDTQVTVAAEVALNLIDLRSAQARLALANANATSQQETLQLTQWRVQAGLATSLESEQARAALQQTLAQRAPLATVERQALHALAVLCGQAPAALEGLLRTPAAVPQAPADLALSLPADTLRQRADLRAAEADVDAALSAVAEADAARKPSLRLAGSLGLNALSFGGLGAGAALAANVLAGLSAPLFDGGAGVAQVRVQQEVLASARAAYRSALLTALQEVENALVALRNDQERLARLQQASEAAANAALLARQRYSSGLIDFQVVLETQRTLLGTQDGAAAARAEIARDHVRLYKALGGGWRADALDAATATTGPTRVTFTSTSAP